MDLDAVSSVDGAYWGGGWVGQPIHPIIRSPLFRESPGGRQILHFSDTDNTLALFCPGVLKPGITSKPLHISLLFGLQLSLIESALDYGRVVGKRGRKFLLF
jgi:hypothetical protein